MFGGNKVHVFNKTLGSSRLHIEHQLYRSICVRSNSEQEDAQALRSGADMTAQQGFAERHEKCLPACFMYSSDIVSASEDSYEDSYDEEVSKKRKKSRKTSTRKSAKKNMKSPKSSKSNKSKLTKPSMDLTLLQVCRQIHAEAALLPYENNTFVFDGIIELEAFVEFLNPAQVAAVQHISYEYHEFHSDQNFEQRLQAKLTSLKSLILFVNMDGDAPPKVGDDETACLLRFKRLPTTTAIVAAYTSACFNPWNVNYQKLAIDWDDHVEKQLLTEWMEPEQKEGEKAKA